MLKRLWVAEMPFPYPFPQPIENHCRYYKPVAGSSIIHDFLFSIGDSVALQTGEPKVETEASTFRWNISLATAPLPEPITSDTPFPSLAASPRKSVVPHSEPSDSLTPPLPRETSLTRGKGGRRNPATEESAQTKTIELPFTGFRVEPSLIKHTQEISPSRTTGSSSPRLSQGKTLTMSFAQGQTAWLPPPVKRVVDRTEQVMQPGTLEKLRVLQRPQAFQLPVQRRRIRPDYGWLIHDLRILLERLKFYPQVARTNKWQGKVVVHMKILESGPLIDMEIQENSGFEVLDQTALTIVRQASPPDLGHPLHANNVRLSVSLTFRLE